MFFTKLLERVKSSYITRKRRALLVKSIRNKGGIIGKGVSITVIGGGVFNYGNNIKISSSGSELATGCYILVLSGAKLEIGDNTGMSQVSIVCRDGISIGSNCKIGAGVKIIDTNFHNTNWQIRRTPDDLRTAKTAPVFIGDDVFIGTRCIICKGVTIGARSIIAAGSVVIKDIPEDCIAGGNPCRVIKHINE